MAEIDLLSQMPLIWTVFTFAAFLVLGLSYMRRPRLARQRVHIRSARDAAGGEQVR